MWGIEPQGNFVGAFLSVGLFQAARNGAFSFAMHIGKANKRRYLDLLLGFFLTPPPPVKLSVAGSKFKSFASKVGATILFDFKIKKLFERLLLLSYLANFWVLSLSVAQLRLSSSCNDEGKQSPLFLKFSILGKCPKS